ncbi:DNA polymerase III subunit chi [Ramlibacter albus]|uniref:DNA polymerase III subunit chi n=1 Tax=Ramlibacter albus TaxID=2079448 RepID=A0A923S1E0_9BURK|nr:DNA polymerase III subunit chi [Ramlibacter albus]MBC5764314.1 DNA polymerase III subunit chi [Ramlibacter albus]
MTEVTFHYNVADKVGHVCKLVQLMAGKGNRVVVTGDSEALRRLDVALWTFEALEFIPHCYTRDAADEVVAKSPVVLADSARGTPHHQVLLNVGPGVPEGFERFERLVEVVTQDEQDRLDGRARTRHYKDRGYSVRHYNVVTKEMR